MPMKKHARLTFGITKKKRFAATMVVVAVVLVMALVVLGYVGVFGLRSELCQVSATSDRDTPKVSICAESSRISA